ncbi:MAG: glycosyltransferase [Candidatus Binatia bacterium]|nr:glycosyltransferase [Candidatus Binatia bacterium]MDG2008434.1 glycosyltransferase [Candidatus Binatia bacterium]
MEPPEINRPQRDRGWWTRRWTQARMRAYLRHALSAAQRQTTGRVDLDFQTDIDPQQEAAASWLREHEATLVDPEQRPIPETVPDLAILILVVGTRGDVQPFIPIGKELMACGHRVRLATHEEFRELVEASGIEFFPLAADPRELIAYMVRTGGSVLPTNVEQFREDVPRKREMITEILESTWQAAIATDPTHPDRAPFVADAIIANPPCFGHIHVAEALHAPLQIIFTMPWTPTTAFSHPLANMGQGAHGPVENWLSFLTIDFLTWAGSADLINRFRENTLGIEPILLGEGGASLLQDNEVPTTYLWSPAFVGKPADWGDAVDIAGFCFLEQAASFDPPSELTDFLEEGPPPFYIGFGSCMIENPAEATAILREAIHLAGIRAILSQGWAGLGEGLVEKDVLVVGDLPHDWLFPHLAGICHHGGAGTVAAGLRAGLPTVVIPFFGDQYFWGSCVARAGAGPEPIPFTDLRPEKLADAFRFCQSDEAHQRAEEISVGIQQENGVQAAVDAFHRHLPLEPMACQLDAGHLARRYCEDCRIALCLSCDALVHESEERQGHDRTPWRWVDWGIRPPQNLAEGLEQGLGHAAGELFRAARDAVRSPIDGAHEGGALGLARGLGEGLVGLVRGPVRGGVAIARKVASAVEPQSATAANAFHVLHRSAADHPQFDAAEKARLLRVYEKLERD